MVKFWLEDLSVLFDTKYNKTFNFVDTLNLITRFSFIILLILIIFRVNIILYFIVLGIIIGCIILFYINKINIHLFYLKSINLTF